MQSFLVLEWLHFLAKLWDLPFVAAFGKIEVVIKVAITNAKELVPSSFCDFKSSKGHRQMIIQPLIFIGMILNSCLNGLLPTSIQFGAGLPIHLRCKSIARFNRPANFFDGIPKTNCQAC